MFTKSMSDLVRGVSASLRSPVLALCRSGLIVGEAVIDLASLISMEMMRP